MRYSIECTHLKNGQEYLFQYETGNKEQALEMFNRETIGEKYEIKDIKEDDVKFRDFFSIPNIEKSDYESKTAKGYSYNFNNQTKNIEVVMVTQINYNISVPYIYVNKFDYTDEIKNKHTKEELSNIVFSDKEKTEALASVLLYEMEQGNEWAKKVFEKADEIWNCLKLNSECNLFVKDHEICVERSNYRKVLDVHDIEYFLTYDSLNVIEGSDNIFDIARQIVDYDKELDVRNKELKSIKDYFVENNIAELYKKTYSEWNEKDKEVFSYYSDWHKDIFNYRPRGFERDACYIIIKQEQNNSKHHIEYND